MSSNENNENCVWVQDQKPMGPIIQFRPNNGWKDKDGWGARTNKVYVDVDKHKAGSYSFSTNAGGEHAWSALCLNLWWLIPIPTEAADISFEGEYHGNMLVEYYPWGDAEVRYDIYYYLIHKETGEVKEVRFDHGRRTDKGAEFIHSDYSEEWNSYELEFLDHYEFGVKVKASSHALGLCAAHSHFGHKESPDYFWTLDWIYIDCNW